MCRCGQAGVSFPVTRRSSIHSYLHYDEENDSDITLTSSSDDTIIPCRLQFNINISRSDL